MKPHCHKEIGISFAALLVLLCNISATSVKERKPLVILFSNSSNGILRSCYCPNSPWGGLAKRAWLVEQIRTEVGKKNVLLLDTGDLFPAEADPERVPFIMRLYALMNYDAVAMGDQEFIGGFSRWEQYNMLFAAGRRGSSGDQEQQTVSFPWLSAGYRITEGPLAGKMPARPWTVRNVAGYRVGIVSITGKSAYRFASTEKLAGMKLTDPKTVIDKFVQLYKDKTDLIIVLSHQGREADHELAKNITGVDLIIGGHSQSLISPPESIGDVLICQAGKNGENLGVLLLKELSVTGDGLSINGQNGGEGSSPFEPAVVLTRKWRVIQQFIPLDSGIDEKEDAAKIIDEYYAVLDQRREKRLTQPPRAEIGEPRLVVENPVQYTVIRAGAKRRFGVNLWNSGSATLEIKKVRSKIRWLKVVHFPEYLLPGETGQAVLDLHAEQIDRFFRSEYTITSNDKDRIVVSGTINGRIQGPLPGITQVPEIMRKLLALMGGNSQQEQAEDVGRKKDESPSQISQHTGRQQVLVEFFYAAGCYECREVKEQILPELKRRYADRIDLREYDIYEETNYLRLAELQEKLNIRTDEKVSIYLNGKIHVGGLKTIKNKLFGFIEQLTDIPEG